MSKKLSRGSAWPLDGILASSHHKNGRAEAPTDLLPANIINVDDVFKKGGIKIRVSYKIPSEMVSFHPARIKYQSIVTIR